MSEWKRTTILSTRPAKLNKFQWLIEELSLDDNWYVNYLSHSNHLFEFRKLSCLLVISATRKYFYKASISNSNGVVLCTDFLKPTNCSTTDTCSVPEWKGKLFGEAYLPNLASLPNDDILITICVYAPEFVTNNYQCSFSPIDYLIKLATDLKSLQIAAGEDPEVALCIGSDIVYANKAILCTKSSVFDKMFNSEMKEDEQNSVTIEDIDIEMHVLRKTVDFLYSGTITETDIETLLAMHYVADKYCIRELKVALTDRFVVNLTVNNACSVLMMSDQQDNEFLKKEVIDYISTRLDSVVVTKDWQNLMHCNTALASEVTDLTDKRRQRHLDV